LYFRELIWAHLTQFSPPNITTKDAYLNPFEISKSSVVGVPHTGYWGTVNGGGENEVKKMWMSLSNDYHHLIQ
jgi:hypothetical protein